MKRRKVLIEIIGIILIFGVTVVLNFAQSQSEKEELVKIASQTVENSIKQTYQGEGVAKVIIHTEVFPPETTLRNFDTGETIIKPRGTEIEKKEEKCLVEFAFKGESSISKRYEIKKDGERGEPISANINTPETSFYYDKNLAFAAIVPTETSQSIFMVHSRERGYDFHPETFTRFSSMPFSKQINMFLKYAKTINVDYIDDGLLQLTLEGDKVCDYCVVSAVLTLDPIIDFLPVEYKYAFENKKQKYSATSNYHAQWKRYSSGWYIKALKSEETSKKKEESLPAKYNIEIEILSFNPDVKIEDSKFNFENLPLLKGTRVNDKIKGTNYKWGEEEEKEESEKEKIETGLFD